VTAPGDDPRIHALRSRLRPPLAMLGVVIAGGASGYFWMWRDVPGAWLDALYMTVITITTVGYGEVRPLGPAGRVFTMAVAITGVATLFYTATVVMEYIVTVRLVDPGGRRRRMQREITALEGHIVVAGVGRVGRQACEELSQAGSPFVIVDPNPARVDYAAARQYRFVSGDATEDEVLERAGIRRARGLIVTTGNDATNMYIVLSARVLNPKLFIVSRAVDEASVPKLTRAGADRAISPYAIGGHRLAHLILSPTVVDFFETALRRGDESLNIESLALAAESASVGRTLESLNVRRETGATVLAVMRNGNAVPNPPPEFVLAAGDQLLALGTAAQLAELERLIAGGRRG
jgi:voltage-gated potassium channel